MRGFVSAERVLQRWEIASKLLIAISKTFKKENIEVSTIALSAKLLRLREKDILNEK